MQIQQAKPAVLPGALRAELQTVSKSDTGMPGFIMEVQPLVTQSESIRSAMEGLGLCLGQSPCIVIPPKETSAIFAHDKELDLLRSIAGLIGERIHPHIKTGVDVVWLVYRAFQLREDWKQPGRDTGLCLFKLANIALGAASVTGRVYPDLKLNDAWANGFNFVVKGGAALWEGKTLPVNELAFSTEKRLEIPLKMMKVAGISLDPSPVVFGSSLAPMPRPQISRISSPEASK